MLAQVRRWYVGLLFALQEAWFSIKRLRAMVFGEQRKKHKAPPTEPSATLRESEGVASAVGA